jgi:hypothetical protein
MNSQSDRAYQVEIGGNGNTVTATFDNAIRHIARCATPNDAERALWRDQHGSYAQKVRLACNGERFEAICIIEHNLQADIGHSTDVFWLDLIGDFDVGYEFMRAINLLHDTEDPVSEIADELAITVREGIDYQRKSATDDAVIERMKKIERLMGGEALIPETGTATEALDQLPGIVSERFNTYARESFPEDAPAL